MPLSSHEPGRRTGYDGSTAVFNSDESSRRFTVRRLARSPRAAATSAAIVTLTVYLSTMYPGLAGIGDTPKFQFVGSVLGTPHSPGYPLYMLLSWAVAHVRVGTLAFRMNALSAVCAAAAAGGFALVLVELGCLPMVAAAGALSIAFGRVVWSQALLAEVYALNAALFAGVLLWLFRWTHSRRDGDLLRAVGFAALGAAHHLTLVMTAPALLVYAVLTDRRVLRPALLVRAAVIVCAGLSLYGLIWLRTAQHAPYLEARASSLGDLFNVVTARQFRVFLSSFSFGDLWRERAPLMLNWLQREIRWPGVVCASIGLAGLAWTRWRELLLFGASAAVIVLFAMDYDVYDVEVFLILPMIIAGLVAAVGMQHVVAWIGRRFGAPVSGVAAVLLLLVPYGQFRANVAVNNHHRHTFENELFDRLFRVLPPGSAIVAENYPIDHMVLYKLIGEKAGRLRGIELIEQDPNLVRAYARAGRPVYAFEGARRRLEGEGLQFTAAELPLVQPHNAHHLADTESPSIAYPLSRVVPQHAVDAPVMLISIDHREMTTSARWRVSP